MGALLSQFLNKYPYTDFHELNADWMIKTMIDLISQVEDFVSLNAVKYADPIQWNITSQYEKNTIVIDPLTGTAYISVKPVPMGVALTNTDYWTVVFDLGSFVVRAAKNFTDRYEADTTLTATFPSSVGDWLVWGDVLYKVISNIVAGDQYVVDSNIQHFTMEDVYIELVTNILTVDNNLKGSIGVNELDSTTATQNFNAGVLVWVGGQLYMTLTPINSGDTFVSGTNITPVRVDDFVNDRVDNAENRLRGSIGVNELDSTTATQNFNAGVLVWAGGQLYMTLTPINSGDTFVSGTNITPVTVNDFILDRINSNIQDLMGSIAINEGSSITATLNIPSGHLVWVDGNLYMTLTNINVGDTFVNGTNITAVHIDDYTLDRINVLVASELAKYSTEGYKVSNKKFIFVGDSFGDSSNRGFNCWPEIFASNLGLSASQWANLCTDSAGIWAGSPNLLFIYQLQNYGGDRDAITDIIIGEAMNDSVSDDINSASYATIKQNFKDIVDYVKSEYPNATLYIASIGNAIDVSPNIGVRVYKARLAFRKNLFDWCAEYNVNVLYGTEYALCGGLTWFLSDQIHPNLTGETYLGNAITRAYTSRNADISYFYKDEYVVYPTTNFTDLGSMTSEVELQNELTFIRIYNIGFNVTQGATINNDFQFLGSPNIWMNDDFISFGFIRFHAFDGVSERIIPCNFIFRHNSVIAHLYDIDGSGNWVTSWTADAGAYITVDYICTSTNSDRIV